MTSATNPVTPYVGPRPFLPTDRDIFFGRDEETKMLSALVGAYSTVLFYAQSGAGKSSLINAGLIPALEGEEMQLLPSVRVGVQVNPQEAEQAANIYIYNILSTWAGSNHEDLSRQTLAEYLRGLTRPSDDLQIPLPRLLIIDQFEEIFTTYPDRWKDREDFFKQLANALQEDPQLSVLLVMREDYIAELDPYKGYLPGKLQTRLRLERLRREQALLAITKPLEQTGKRFDEGVAEKLVDDLMAIQLEADEGAIKTVQGEYVEPVVLQVVCENLWAALDEDSPIVTAELVQRYARVTDALINFYDACLRDTLHWGAESNLSEDQLRRWFSEVLMTPAGTRSTTYQDVSETGGMPNAIVRFLEDMHLIRGEQRANARWYELSHDRFIQPIQRSNEVWFLEQERLRAEEERARAQKVERKYTGAEINSRVYISYSRLDKELVQRLYSFLTEQGADVWVDFDDLTLTSEWAEEIRSGIESSDTFLFILSPSALASQVCNDELQYARQLHKRIIPIVIHPIDNIDGIVQPSSRHNLDFQAISQTPKQAFGDLLRENWQFLTRLNWLYMRETDSFAEASERLLQAAIIDLEHIKMHTRLLTMALEWERRGRGRDTLLRGAALVEAEAWFSQDKQPAPTKAHFDFIQASRNAVQMRQRRILYSAGVLLAVMAVLVVVATASAIFAAQQQDEAQTQANRAATEAQLAAQQAATAQAAQATSDANAIIADQNAATAIVAQDEALIQANIAETQAAIAVAAQDEALIQANIAETQAALADQNAIIAQSLALAGIAQQILANRQPPDAALSLAVQANTLTDPPPIEARQALVSALHDSHIIRRLNPIPNTSVLALDFSPNGSETALGYEDGRLVMLDVFSNSILYELDTGLSSIEALRFDPSGERLALGGCVALSEGLCSQGGLIILAAEDGAVLHEYSELSSTILSLAYSPDGARLVSSSENGGIFLWDVEAGQPLYSTNAHLNAANSIAFSPDGGWFVSSSFDGDLKIWSVESRALIRQIAVSEGQPIISLALSPDGRLVVAGGQNGRIMLVDTFTGELIRTLQGHQQAVTDLAISPDGRYLISVDSGGLALLWNLSQGEIIRQLGGHTQPIWALDYASDGRYALTGSDDGPLILWDVAADMLASYEFPSTILQSVAFHPDGRSLLSGGLDGVARQIDVTSGALIQSRALNGPIQQVVISPDGEYAVVVGDQTLVWELNIGRSTFLLINISGVAFKADSSGFSFTSPNGAPAFWSIVEERVIPIAGLEDQGGNVIALSADGRYLALAYPNGGVTVWDNGAQQIARFDEVATSLAFHPDSQTLVIANQSESPVIRAINGLASASPISLSAAASPISQVSYSPDGRLIAGGALNGDIILWDAASGEIIRTLRGSLDRINSLSFSTDGSRLASASDTAISLWEIPNYGDDLVGWALTYRHVAPLTCAQRATYRLQPLCESVGVEVALLTSTPYPTLLPSATFTASPTASPSPSPTDTATATNTATVRPSPTDTATATASPSPTDTATATDTPTPSFTPTPSNTATPSPSPTNTASPIAEDILTQVAQLPSQQAALQATQTALSQPTPRATLRATQGATFAPDIGATQTQQAEQTALADQGEEPEATSLSQNTALAETANAQQTTLEALSGQLTQIAQGNPATIEAAIQGTQIARQPTATFTPSPSDTPLPTNTPTPSDTPTATLTPSPTDTPSQTASPTPSIPGYIATSLAAAQLDPSIGFVAQELSANITLDLSGRGAALRRQLLEGNYENFAVGTTIEWGGGALDDECGIAFRIGTSGRYYRFTINREGLARLTYVHSSDNVLSARSNGSLIQVGRTNTNQLLIVGYEDTFTVYINGRYAGEFIDFHLDRGQIGLEARTLSGGTQSSCSFRDSFVYGLSSPPNPARLRHVADFEGGNSSISLVRFSPDSQILASTGNDFTARLWDIESRERLHSFTRGNNSNDIEFSFDKRLFATTATEGRINVWDVQTGNLVYDLRLHQNVIRPLAFSPVADYLVSGDANGVVYLWDMASETGDVLRELRLNSTVADIIFSPDGRLVAIVTEDNRITIWEVESGQILHRLEGHTRSPIRIRFNADGSLLGSASWDRSARIWDVEGGSALQVMQTRDNLGANQLAFSPDGALLAVGYLGGRVKLWDVANGQERYDLVGMGGDILDVDFSPDGRYVAAVGFDYNIYLWDVASGQVSSIVFSDNQTVRIWSVEFSPDGRFMATGGSDQLLRLWSLER